MTEHEFELLKKINVISRDNGKEFTHTQRLDAIKEVAANTEYRLIAEKPLFHLYAKDGLENIGEDIVVISSHADCVKAITEFFTEKEENLLKGTFDNSITNTAALLLMEKGSLPSNVVFAFTGDEERESRGAEALTEFLHDNGKYFFAVVLDVTHEGYAQNMPFTVENDFWYGAKLKYKDCGKTVISAADKVSEYWGFVAASRIIVPEYVPARCKLADEYGDLIESACDESWLYDEYDVPCFSLCLPTCGSMHSNAGLTAKEESFGIYVKALENIAEDIGKLFSERK